MCLRGFDALVAAFMRWAQQNFFKDGFQYIDETSDGRDA